MANPWNADYYLVWNYGEKQPSLTTIEPQPAAIPDGNRRSVIGPLKPSDVEAIVSACRKRLREDGKAK